MSNCGEPEVFITATNSQVMKIVKSCDNCLENRCDAILFTLCMNPVYYTRWQPGYALLQQFLADTQQELTKTKTKLSICLGENDGLVDKLGKAIESEVAKDIELMNIRNELTLIQKVLLEIRRRSNEEDVVRMASEALQKGD